MKKLGISFVSLVLVFGLVAGPAVGVAEVRVASDVGLEGPALFDWAFVECMKDVKQEGVGLSIIASGSLSFTAVSKTLIRTFWKVTADSRQQRMLRNFWLTSVVASQGGLRR